MNIDEDSLQSVTRFRVALFQVLSESLCETSALVDIEKDTGQIVVLLSRSRGHAMLPAYRITITAESLPAVV